MVDPTGTIHEDFQGKSYDLRLTTRGIATLQDKYGNNVAGLLDGTAGDLPKFGALLDLVSVSLQKGSKISVEEADEIADEMLTHDTEIVGRIISAAFPEEKSGNVKKPKKKAA
uniref:hypothetical protein n=1 Tax=Yoonia sp. TaxID=2212373 RepID=UPI0040482988